MGANSHSNAERPIAVGDLVQVVRPRPCCPEKSRLGGTFTVTAIRDGAWLECAFCHKVADADTAELSAFPGRWIERFRLKRIPPLDELEGQRIQEDLREPA